MTEQKLKNTIHNDRWSWLWLIVATGLSCSFRLDGWERCRSPLKGGGIPLRSILETTNTLTCKPYEEKK